MARGKELPVKMREARMAISMPYEEDEGPERLRVILEEDDWERR